ncbi:hypothetical protein NHX12_016283, partial [Muraenolepis orangiensis]
SCPLDGHHRRSPRSSIHSECMVMPVSVSATDHSLSSSIFPRMHYGSAPRASPGRIRHPVHSVQRLFTKSHSLPSGGRWSSDDNLDSDSTYRTPSVMSRHPPEHLSHCYPLDPPEHLSHCYPLDPPEHLSHCYPLDPPEHLSHCYPLDPPEHLSHCYPLDPPEHLSHCYPLDPPEHLSHCYPLDPPEHLSHCYPLDPPEHLSHCYPLDPPEHLSHCYPLDPPEHLSHCYPLDPPEHLSHCYPLDAVQAHLAGDLTLKTSRSNNDVKCSA